MTTRAALAGIGAVALLAVGTAVANAAMSSPTSYRLARVTTGSPDPALIAVGTIEPVRQSTLTFPIAGRVATVAVRPGERVTAGQVVATLDTTALSAQLAEAKSTVAAARAKLDADQNAQAATATGSDGAGSARGAGTDTRATGPAASSTPSTVSAASPGFSLTALQKPLLADQNAADAALVQARAALAEATAICRATVKPRPRPSADAPTTPAPTPSTTTTPGGPARPPTPTADAVMSSPADGGPPSSPAPRTASPVTGRPDTMILAGGLGPSSVHNTGRPTCDAAESQALAWEITTYQDEQKVITDEAALDRALAKAARGRTANSTVGRRPSISASTSATDGARPTAVARSGGTTTTTTTATTTATTAAAAGSGAVRSAAPTAEQLAADQSAIDAATAGQHVAEQDLDQAELISPDTGTVRSVTMTVGDEVSAGSTTEDVVLSGAGGEQAVVNVPVSALDTVAQGQRATVTPDGSTSALTGTVTSIAVLPSSSTTGTTYPVTVALDGGTTVADGSTATVSLLAGNDRGDTTVVPTSAVMARGRGYAVQVDNHGTITTIPVTVGASGPVYTQITGGLTAGQEVVIANLTSPLPTSNSGVRGLVGAGGGGAGGGRAGTAAER